ncbi:hypothetical protein [Hyphomonas sp. CY54-11-8]|jgi:hypothetical protein|uniref:hypothetical protein n=1 Tax=Hyphomonas sp. CY54-11-8 TaxID=1280944 RepID=UPI001112C672|nr:hypothetical protein [Hyphomonas sp. CY54-11-8]
MNTSYGFVVCAQFLGIQPEDLVYIISSRLNEDVPVSKAQSVLRGNIPVPKGWWDALRSFWSECKEIGVQLADDHQAGSDSGWCMCLSEKYPAYMALPLLLAMLEISGDQDVSVKVDCASRNRH